MLDLAAAEARPHSRLSGASAGIDGLDLHPPAA
jgi:hypothetical protein